MNNFIDAIINSFYKNLVAGDAYLVVLKGLWVTIMISTLGLLFGTIFGGLLCWLRMSGIKFLNKISQLIIAVLRGSPVLLLLMLLYYVAFANSRIDAGNTGQTFGIPTFVPGTPRFYGAQLFVNL